MLVLSILLALGVGVGVGVGVGYLWGRRRVPARIRAVLAVHETAIRRLQESRDAYEAAAQSHEVKWVPPKRSAVELVPYARCFFATVREFPDVLARELGEDTSAFYHIKDLECKNVVNTVWKSQVKQAGWTLEGGAPITNGCLSFPGAVFTGTGSVILGEMTSFIRSLEKTLPQDIPVWWEISGKTREAAPTIIQPPTQIVERVVPEPIVVFVPTVTPEGEIDLAPDAVVNTQDVTARLAAIAELNQALVAKQ